MLRTICLRWLYNCGLNGEIDFQDRHIAALQNMPLFLDGKETGGYRIFRKPPDPMNTMVIIMLNQTHWDPVMREIFNRRDFRVALSLGMDRQEIIDAIHVGQGEPYRVAPRPESHLQNEQLAANSPDTTPRKPVSFWTVSATSASQMASRLGQMVSQSASKSSPTRRAIPTISTRWNYLGSNGLRSGLI